MQTSRIRQIYEKHPYPAADKTALTKNRWLLPPFEWIRALWKPGQKGFAPARILVAGCGTGSEAFALRRKFPKARIVAVDFSPGSIGIARKLQKRVKEMRSIQFAVAELAHRNLRNVTGGDFDFISCHGVLSYIPAPKRVLVNLARQLKPDGALYLGVNGTEHFSAHGRSFLPEFGFDMSALREGAYLRKILKFWDSVLDHTGIERLTLLSTGYLAGDLFGPLIQNLPLDHWLTLARDAGLHFQSSYFCWRRLRATMAAFPKLLMPRSRSELCQLLELLAPARFHRLLFTREPAMNPSWQHPDALRACYPVWTNLYGARLPKQTRRWQALRHVTFQSSAVNTRLDWKLTEWQLEILRQSNGCRTVGEILAGMRARVREDSLRQNLYVLHQLLVISLLPKSPSLAND